MASTYFFVLIALCFVIYFSNEVKADCGGVITENYGIIKSPLYPSNYPPSQNCLWEIKMPPNSRIDIYFNKFHLEACKSCSCDYVRVASKMKDGKTIGQGKFCGSEEIPPITSLSNILLIEFKSDNGVQPQGFQIEFYNAFTECGGIIEATEGVITSPYFPFLYPPNSHCTWTIIAPRKQSVKLNFTNFTTKESRRCDNDYVDVLSEMADGEIEEHGHFCGSKVPSVIYSKSNVLVMKLVLNGTSGSEDRRFRAEFVFEGLSGLISSGNGNINSPYFPNSYPPNKVSEWTFLVPPQHKLKLHFSHFDLEEGDGCRNDFLLIQSNSTDGEIREYGKYCGVARPPLITSEDSLLLKFVSDRSIQGQGFKAEYFFDEFTEYESSTLTKSRAPAYQQFTSTVENQYVDISTESAATSRNDENTFTDEYQSTIPSVSEASTSDHSTTDSEKKEIEHLMRNVTNIWPVMKVLTEKMASLEERQLAFFNNFEKYINVSRSVKSKNGSLED